MINYYSAIYHRGDIILKYFYLVLIRTLYFMQFLIFELLFITDLLFSDFLEMGKRVYADNTNEEKIVKKQKELTDIPNLSKKNVPL